MFQMLDVFAEFERGIIRERVNAGLARARANGTKLGRRRETLYFCPFAPISVNFDRYLGSQ